MKRRVFRRHHRPFPTPVPSPRSLAPDRAKKYIGSYRRKLRGFIHDTLEQARLLEQEHAAILGHAAFDMFDLVHWDRINTYPLAECLMKDSALFSPLRQVFDRAEANAIVITRVLRIMDEKGTQSCPNS